MKLRPKTKGYLNWNRRSINHFFLLVLNIASYMYYLKSLSLKTLSTSSIFCLSVLGLPSSYFLTIFSKVVSYSERSSMYYFILSILHFCLFSCRFFWVLSKEEVVLNKLGLRVGSWIVLLKLIIDSFFFNFCSEYSLIYSSRS